MTDRYSAVVRSVICTNIMSPYVII